MASIVGGIILWCVGNGAGHDLVDGNCVGFTIAACKSEGVFMRWKCRRGGFFGELQDWLKRRGPAF